MRKEKEMEKNSIKNFKVEYVSFILKYLSPNGTCSVNQSIRRGINLRKKKKMAISKSNQIKIFSL